MKCIGSLRAGDRSSWFLRTSDLHWWPVPSRPSSRRSARDDLISQDVIVSCVKFIVVSGCLTEIAYREVTIMPHAGGERAQASGSLRLSPGEPHLGSPLLRNPVARERRASFTGQDNAPLYDCRVLIHQIIEDAFVACWCKLLVVGRSSARVLAQRCAARVAPMV